MGHINFNNVLFNSLSKISSFQCTLNRKIINQFLHLLFFLPVCKCLVAQSCPILCDPLDYSLPSSSVTGFFRQEYQSGLPFPSPGIFQTQGSNPHLLCLLDLLHCRWILNPLNHQGIHFIPIVHPILDSSCFKCLVVLCDLWPLYWTGQVESMTPFWLHNIIT